jgi:hypothetical protein
MRRRAARAFQRSGLPRQQGAVVPNKLLAGVLDRIKQDELGHAMHFDSPLLAPTERTIGP